MDLEVIVKYGGDLSRPAAELNAAVEILSDDFAIITLDESKTEKLNSYPEIIYIEFPKSLFRNLENAARASCAPETRAAYNLTGAGTIVALPDSGIDFRHPDFRNADGSTRILFIWDQTAPPSADAPPPKGFAAGAEYSAEKIDGVLSGALPPDAVPTRDTAGHGTAVAGIAAGNGRASGGRQTGVAPGASIIAVKLGRRGYESFARTTELMRALKYFTDKARALNMPLAVNISYGTNNGAHDGGSLFENYIDEISQKWKTAICAATGNEGAAGHHFAGRAGNGETVIADFNVAPAISNLYMTLWKNYADTFTVEIIAPDGKSSGAVTPARFRTETNLGGGASVTIFYGRPTHYSVGQEILFLFRGGSGGLSARGLSANGLSANGAVPAGLWTLKVTGNSVTYGNFNIWLPVTEEVSERTSFLRPSADYSLTLPSDAASVISVAGYNSEANASAEFSGRGQKDAPPETLKPDLAAPAVNILTAHSGGGYDAHSGTSMAAPFVTGAAALLMEWGIARGNDPFLYGQKVKAALRKGARREPNGIYPDNAWGYGRLCVKGALDALAV